MRKSPAKSKAAPGKEAPAVLEKKAPEAISVSTIEKRPDAPLPKLSIPGIEKRPDPVPAGEKRPDPDKGEKKKDPKRKSFSKFGVGAELSYFIENLSMLLTSGMVIMTALAAIKKDIKSKTMREAITQIENGIDGGGTLWESLSVTGIFPAYAIALIRVGEQTGRLGANLQVIASQQQKEREFKSKVKSALMYPVFVFGLTAVIGLGIAWFILPKLATVFTQLAIPLPLVTRLLIRLGGFLGEYGLYVIPAIMLLAGAVMYFVFGYRRTNFIGQAILFAIPPIRKLILEGEMARLGYILGTLLGSGLPVVESFNSLASATTYYRYQKFYYHLRDRIEEGNSLEHSFASFKSSPKLIPLPFQQLIVTSEQSGNLAVTLMKVSEIFEQKLNTTTKNLSVILEPILLVMVWLGVVTVAVAVILPLYSLVGNFNGGI